MFQPKSTHVCTIGEESSGSFLPPLTPTSPLSFRCKRFLKKLILITEVNPQSIEYFRKISAIQDARRKQIVSGSWVIHPFSTFRLYYEMWMSFIFFICLIYMPMEASFKHMLPTNLNGLDSFLCTVCLVDVLMNFRTGYCANNEKIVMKPSSIAKHYVFGIYFVPDVLSSIPEMHQLNLFVNEEIAEVLDYFAMLKIVRILTFIQYTKRMFAFFNVKAFAFLMIKIGLMAFLITHYVACCLYFLPILFRHVKHNEFTRHNANPQSRSLARFINFYLNNSYSATSLVLGVEVDFNYKSPWITYVFCIIIYVVGKFLSTYVTVILVDVLRVYNCLETKFYEMMSQVDSFMTAHQFPLVLQKKLQDYYHYKYRGRYVNESRIEKFISEKLRKEIKYHDCRRLVNSVNIFEHLPQEILEDILSYLKQEIYLASDVIIKAGTVGDGMYFLSSGTVAVSSPSGKEICHLVDGDYFGEIALLVPKQKRIANIIALETCQVYKLERKSFKKVMDANKDLYRQILDQAKLRHSDTKEIERMFIKKFEEP
ncbi:unnamed protein product [Tenebrio molitor]|nr:unnamed protein product [Tenebrio molitor]